MKASDPLFDRVSTYVSESYSSDHYDMEMTEELEREVYAEDLGEFFGELIFEGNAWKIPEIIDLFTKLGLIADNRKENANV